MTVRSYAASLKGKRVGIIAASSGGTQVLVHVSPKSFDSAAMRDVPLIRWSDRGTIRIALTETQRLHVYEDKAQVFFEDLVRRLTSAASGNRRSKGTAESLLSVASTPAAWSHRPPDGVPDCHTLDGRIVDLLLLLERVGFLDPASGSIDGSDRAVPLLRPLLVRRFLDEVESRVPQVRRGYRTVTERRGVVRGRVHTAGLVRLRTTGVPQLTCTYDELTESTELLQVICTALEAVADGRGRSSAFPGRFGEAVLRRDAVRHRRALGLVEAAPVRSALATGRQLRLGRLDQPWAAALGLALRILAGIEAEPARSDLSLEAAEISVETEKIWERILTQALQRVEPRLDVRTPRKSSHGDGVLPEVTRMWTLAPEPDNVVVRESDMMVFDAKYKRFTGSPGRDDQYQMFAYSHLVGDDRRSTSSLVLVYPTDHTAPSDDGEQQDDGVSALGAAASLSWGRGSLGADPEAVPRLHVLKLRFPSTDDLQKGRWSAYLDAVAGDLQSFIAAQHPPTGEVLPVTADRLGS